MLDGIVDRSPKDPALRADLLSVDSVVLNERVEFVVDRAVGTVEFFCDLGCCEWCAGGTESVEHFEDGSG
ncbi:hypothetical protein A4G99_12270 [Haladaptatus sp. R4]|nr:hypothetical protein A4G99_12270 [Haladaptatus sp. R4]